MHTMAIRLDRAVRMQRHNLSTHPEVMEEIEAKVRAHYKLDGAAGEEELASGTEGR